MQALRPSKPRGSCNVFPPSNDTVTFSWLDPTQSVYSSEATWNANVQPGEQDEEVQLIPKQTAAPRYAARFSRRFHDQRTTSCQKSTITLSYIKLHLSSYIKYPITLQFCYQYKINAEGIESSYLYVLMEFLPKTLPNTSKRLNFISRIFQVSRVNISFFFWDVWVQWKTQIFFRLVTYVHVVGKIRDLAQLCNPFKRYFWNFDAVKFQS